MENDFERFINFLEEANISYTQTSDSYYDLITVKALGITVKFDAEDRFYMESSPIEWL